MVSRRHAFLGRGEGHWRLEDCGSRNGTCVNGRRLTGVTEATSGRRDRARGRPLRSRGARRLGVQQLGGALRRRLLVEGLRRRERAASRADRGAQSGSDGRCSTSPCGTGRTSHCSHSGTRSRASISTRRCSSVSRRKVPDARLEVADMVVARSRPALRRRHVPLQLDRLRRLGRAHPAGRRGDGLAPGAGRRARRRAVVHAGAVAPGPPAHARDRRAGR